jgi:hypothetical protein
MKRLALGFALAALATATLRAQDNHHGPVVYPADTAPQTEMAPDTNTAPVTADAASGQSFASNAAPAPLVGNPVTMPPANSSPATATPSAPDASSTIAPSLNTAPSTAPDASAPPDASTIAPYLTPATPNTPPDQALAPASPSGSALSPMQGSASAPTAANNKQDDIYDIRPPYFYLRSIAWLWYLLGALALIALAAFFWIRLKPMRVLRAKSAYELALEKLEKARALLNEQNPEPYAVLVSETIRSYLGQRFHTPSTRRTTEEFLRQMQADTSTPLAEHRDLLRHFLEACDLVKFAHYQPGREELEQVQQRAVSFVTATRPVEGVPA